MSHLPNHQPKELLVGSNTGDDAAIWQIDADRCLVSTADFITPVVDDARSWGRIAAANAISDVYAMGAKPLFGLNLVGWNASELPNELLAEVLLGGNDTAEAASMAIVGGHTIDDPEPKYGMAVTGMVPASRFMTNAGLKAGESLILTKPLGVGILTTAIKADIADVAQAQLAVDSMSLLNKKASEIALRYSANGCTDVTGFGLLGHACRMAVESDVSLVISLADIPLLAGTRHFAEAGMVPGGTRRNLAAKASLLDAGQADELDQLIIADAQTSGGLLFGVAEEKALDALAELTESGHQAAIIGTAAPADEMRFYLR